MMNKLMIASAFCGLLFTSAANAATLDFLTESNVERGVLDGTSIASPNFDGLSLSFSADSTIPGKDGFAYFDRGGGLGVCGSLDGSNQCDPSSDDNLTNGETLYITFDDGPVNFSGLMFANAGHNAVDGDDTLLINDVEFTFDAAAAATFLNVSTIKFGFDTANLSPNGAGTANQYYLTGATAVSAVPLPAGLVLLLSGLLGIGFLGRSRSKASATASS